MEKKREHCVFIQSITVFKKKIELSNNRYPYLIKFSLNISVNIYFLIKWTLGSQNEAV